MTIRPFSSNAGARRSRLTPVPAVQAAALPPLNAGAATPGEARPHQRASSTLAVRNGLWSSLASLAGAVAGLVGSVVIVRGLTPDEYGAFSYYLWLASILGTLGSLALPNALTKIRSELRGEQLDDQAGMLSGLVVAILLALNLTIALALVAWAFTNGLPDRTYQLVIALSVIPVALTAVLRSHLWADQRYRPVSIVTILATGVHLALIGVAVWLHWHVTGFLIAALALNAAPCLGLLAVVGWSLPKLSLPRLGLPDTAILRRYVAFAAPAAFVQFSDQLIWQRSGVFFLERESTLDQIGYYSLAFTGFSLFLALGWALVQGYYPAISHDYGAGDWAGIRRRLHQAVELASLYAAPVSLGGLAMLPFLLPLVYGEKVAPSIPVAQVLFAGLLPGVITAVFGLTISAIGGIWLHVRLGLISATVSILANLVLVPRYGAVGSAMANTVSQLTTATMLMVCAYLFYRLDLPWKRAGTILAAGIVSTYILPTVIHELMPDLLGLVLAIVAAAVAYVGLLWWLGYLKLLLSLRGGTP
ncbi:MAG: oligosaccharide flippase family protein [Chloroflexi bacterium]|nr:oligosaccharide flippase family protein [Chloroflexota bacterium]